MSPDAPDLTPDVAGHDTVEILGFVHDVPNKRNIGVYLDPSFRTKIEIPRNLVRQRERIPADDPASVAARSRLLVDETALEKLAPADALKGLETFLTGISGHGKKPTNGQILKATTIFVEGHVATNAHSYAHCCP
jgi:hypothetical protein